MHMSKPSKREQMLAGTSQGSRDLTRENREDLGKQFLGPNATASFQKTLVTLEKTDLEWIDTALREIRKERRRTTKSDLMRAGVALLKEKSPDELCQLVRNVI